MGCDIHLYVEVFRRNRWVTVFGPRFKSERQHRKDDKAAIPWGSLEGILRDYTFPPEIPYTHEYKHIWDHPLYLGRNYDIFAVLAGVRDRHDCTPVAADRGVPDDASYNVHKESIRWGADGHSHSWVTLQELDTFDWDAIAWFDTERVGVEGTVSDGTRYSPTYQQITRTRARHGTQVGAARVAGLQMLRAAHPTNPLVSKAALTHWHTLRTAVTYRTATGHLLTEFLPALRKIAPKGDTSKVRCVFWFDN